MIDGEKSGLSRLLLRSPHFRAALSKISYDPTIRDCCEAYELAWTAFIYWSGAAGALAADLASEYQRTIAELEGEIVDFVRLRAKSDRHSAPGLNR